MKSALDSGGSESQHGEEIVPSPGGGDSTSSRTVSYVSPAVTRGDRPLDVSPAESDQDGPAQPVRENDKTVISQRPVAAPEDFYRSMPLSELAAMLEGRQLDHFSVEQMIGGGGMGAVFRGRDQRLDRIVAVKVIPASKRDPETLRRFRLEAQAAARLDHPNIARVYYVGEAEQWNYIVFEFIDGVNVRDLVEMEGPLSVDDAVYYTRQVAEALQHAHDRDVVHRDIKPSNVLVTAAGIAKVVDMGLARDTSLDKSNADATASGVTLGTFDYIAPEQARNPRDADVRSDLYSLGCTLFYMLTGHPPFPEGTALQKLLNHGSQPPPDPRGWREDLSDQLYEIMMKLMAKRSADRYQKPVELINDLMLLAEVEDLPRSQSPGTLMITPSIAQRSLLESNLPWMVAFAFLLGSTLWLQSVQSLSNGLELPDLEFPSRRVPAAAEPIVGNAAASSPDGLGETPGASAGRGQAERSRDAALPDPKGFSTSGDAINDPVTGTASSLPAFDASISSSGSVGAASVPPAPTALVVSQERPLDVDGRFWERTMERAIDRMQNKEAVGEIEVRGRVFVDQPLVLSGLKDVTIRGEVSSQATIEFSPQLLAELGSGTGLISVDNSKLRCNGLSFEVNVPTDVPTGGELGVFHLRGECGLALEVCSVTVKDLADSQSVVVILATDEVPGDSYDDAWRSTEIAMPVEATAFENRKSIVVSSRSCVVRGEASLMGIWLADQEAQSRFELSFDDVLVAVSGVALQMRSQSRDSVASSFVRLFCKQSTFVTEQGFARLDYQGAPQVGLNRTSQNCVYWSREKVPHVLVRGVPLQNVIGNFDLLLMQGLDNAYDQNIGTVCRWELDQEVLADFGFMDAQVSGWYNERGNERNVNWQQPSVPAMPLHEAQVADLKVVEGMFVPGFPPDGAIPPL